MIRRMIGCRMNGLSWKTLIAKTRMIRRMNGCRMNGRARMSDEAYSTQPAPSRRRRREILSNSWQIWDTSEGKWVNGNEDKVEMVLGEMDIREVTERLHRKLKWRGKRESGGLLLIIWNYLARGSAHGGKSYLRECRTVKRAEGVEQQPHLIQTTSPLSAHWVQALLSAHWVQVYK